MPKILLLTYVTLVLSLFACATPPTYKKFYTGRANFDSLLIASGLTGSRGTLVHHTHYSLVSERWIEEVFTPSFIAFESRNNFPEYETGVWSCGDATDLARQWAKSLWIQEGNKAAAAGKYVYHPDNDNPDFHAIVVFMVGESMGNARAVFYEPQRKEIIKLSDKEKRTCIWVEF